MSQLNGESPFPCKKLDSMGRPMKHGMHKSPENNAWRKMLDRCRNPKSQRYDRYGARGIKVCDRWAESFENFYLDMGPRPSPEHSIDRIDNDGHYEPGNCRWATKQEQNSNRSDNRIVEFNGEQKTLAAWAAVLGIGQKTLGHRLDVGWSVEEAFRTPPASRVWTKSPGRRKNVPEKE